MNPESILFLDFDDVLNTARSLEEGRLFEKTNIDALNQILDRSQARVVVTSMWRIGSNREELEELLLNAGAHVRRRVIGQTPLLQGKSRGSEIRAWIRSSGLCIDVMVILDNRDDMDEYREHLVRTDPASGLNVRSVRSALRLLEGEPLARPARNQPSRLCQAL